MPSAIWKFTLTGPECTIEMPMGAKILTVHMQREAVRMWAVVPSDATGTEKRKFKVYGTGHEMPDDPGKYIGTFFTDSDATFVFHVFEVLA